MSSTDNFPFSVGQQKTDLNADLNSTLLIQFLFGIYTGIFPATMYLYIHKENRTRTRDIIIIGSTAVLYFATTLDILMNWLYTNILYGTKGATRVGMFLESIRQDAPLGEKIVGALTAYIVFVFADGLMVWRCFHACGRSFRKSALPITLLTVETALVLTALAYSLFMDAKPDFDTVHVDLISNHVNAATFVVAAATSIVSTALICLQIWRHTTPSSQSRKHYQTIISALIESSAAYTVVAVFQAILQFINTGDVESSLKVLVVGNFVGAATLIISGLAPTLMIARLCVSSGQQDAEISSAGLPSDLISPASHATGTDSLTNAGDDVEMQQRGSIGVVEDERGEILDESRNVDRLETVV